MKKKVITERDLEATSLSELKDELLGNIGTEKRDSFELELKMELFALTIKQLRKLNNITQEELGEKVGVKKAQISKLEHGKKSATIETLSKIFSALNAEIKFTINTKKKIN